MANTKSAIKEIRVARARAEGNKSVRSEIKSMVRNAREAVKAGDKTPAVAPVRAAQSRLDKAVTQGNLPRNAAARRTSRLAKRLNQTTLKTA